MQIQFLAEAIADLRWFKRYYTSVFPEGRSNANRQYRALLALLKNQPKVGHPSEYAVDVFEYHIPRIPFTVLYRIKGAVIEIMRIYDQRSEFSNER